MLEITDRLLQFKDITFIPEKQWESMKYIPTKEVVGNILVQLGKPIESSLIPTECQYINYPSMGFFLYTEEGVNKCFAISNDSREYLSNSAQIMF